MEITVGKTNTANKSIDHQYYVTSAQHRYQTLKRLIDFNPGIYGIIFTRTKADAQDIAEKLTRKDTILMHCMATLHSSNVIK